MDAVSPDDNVVSSRRSRSGCAECRRRRRKCDEAKPTCSRCRADQRHCEYTRSLVWGGKPFKKSRFGECLADGVDVVRDSSSGGFAYGFRSPPVAAAKPSQPHVFNEIVFESAQIETANPLVEESEENVEPSPMALSLTTHSAVIDSPPTLFPQLSSKAQTLLHHFLSCATLVVSCHSGTQKDYRSILLPMALSTPHLLNAAMSLAATQRRFLALDQSSEADIYRLRASSFMQYRQALSNPENLKGDKGDVALATALTLCMCDVFAGGEQPQTWRVHLRAAGTLIRTQLESDSLSGRAEDDSYTRSFLRRWFLSLAGIALLSGSATQMDAATLLGIAGPVEEEGQIDTMCGFSTHLLPIFGEIVELSRAKKGHIASAGQNSNFSSAADVEGCLSLSSIETRAKAAVVKVKCYLASEKRTVIPDHRSCPPLPEDIFMKFRLLDTAFHHVALLHLYRRILDVPRSEPAVQASVKQILDCVERLEIQPTQPLACPGVAITQPLYTAGCEALEEQDRERMLGLIARHRQLLGVGNTERAMESLKAIWATQGRETTAGSIEDESWEQVLDRKGWDLLCY